MAVLSEERWVTFKLSLEVKLFQARKNSMGIGPKAGRTRLVCSECREQEGAVVR